MTPESDPPPEETAFIPREAMPVSIQIGTVLKDIYEVTGFIAHGGMGEVYEGVSLTTEEKVAIKFIRPHLAKDLEVQKAFREEAKTLIKLSHPALVQYRVMIWDAQLDLFYIVTDFIDGPSLSQVYPKLKPSLNEFKGLLRRLAEGLQVAHDLRPTPVIHRDISPDNILLPGGRLDQAKIIDFGIARSRELSEASVFRDGFKGKISFAAPEQFGAYKGEIGPWTDVYSLGLVALTAASGRPIDMGSNFFEAVEKRQTIPDLKSAPVWLHKLLTGMLEPDPAKRIRSMAGVIDILDGMGVAVPQRKAGQGSVAGAAAGPVDQKIIKPPQAFRPRVVIGALAAAALALTAMAVIPPMLRNSGEAAADTRSTPVALHAAVDTPLKNAACSFLNIDIPDRPAPGAPMTVKLSGLSGDPSALTKLTEDAISKAGLKAQVDWSGVYPVQQKACGPVDVFRQFREPPAAEGPSLTADNNVYHIQANPAPCPTAYGPQAQALTQIRYNTLEDFTLMGMEPSGRLQQMVADKDDFNNDYAKYPSLFFPCANKLCVRNCVDQESIGPAFEVLIKAQTADAPKNGQPKFDLTPLNRDIDKATYVDQDWPKRFAKAAVDHHWTTQMVWFEVQK